MAVTISILLFTFSVVVCDERKRAAEEAARLTDAVKTAGGTPPAPNTRKLIICDSQLIRWAMVLVPVLMALVVYAVERRWV